MHYGNYRLQKTWLDQCLKSFVSQNPSTDNMANGSKHCCSLNDSTFSIFINHSQGSFTGKSLF